MAAGASDHDAPDGADGRGSGRRVRSGVFALTTTAVVILTTGAMAALVVKAPWTRLKVRIAMFQSLMSHDLKTLAERPGVKLRVPLSLVLLGESGAYGDSGTIV